MQSNKLMQEIPILFENDEILALNKPAGIAVHGDGKHDEYTISDWVIEKYPNTKDVGEVIELSDGRTVSRHGIVHRLDKATSGVLLIAKTKEAFWSLKRQFKNREIKKTYHAFIYGKLRDERGIINRPIGRSSGSIRKWATGNKIRGDAREAVTRFKVVKNVTPASFIEVWPQTGRTHQIRVHMQSLGHPVLSDALYAGRRDSFYGFKRLALHATRIVFTDLKGKTIEVKAPYPLDFEEAMREIGVKSL